MLPTDEGPSLEDLGQTYAKFLGQDPYRQAAPPTSGIEEQQEPQDWAADLADDDRCPVTPQSILEAMLFVGRPDNRPLSSRAVAALMRGVKPRDIDELVERLNRQFELDHAAYRIVSRDNGYLLELCPDLESARYRFHHRSRGAKLSPAAIEVLALVAYEQPLTREQIDQRRGARSSGILRQLVRRRLLVQDRDAAGKGVSYRTSDPFLELLGLGSLAQLPDAQSVERA